tara:strand:- start:208 stop:408 length:201 start_codon:yes stop_codon:yes gene_type:complete
MKLKIAMRIREIRKERNISQEILAFNSNVSRRHMTNIELGRVDIRISTLIKISKALDIAPEMLLKS